MLELIGELAGLKDTPVPVILVTGGIVFLLLAFAGGFTGRIEIPPGRQKWAGLTGALLLIFGTIIFVAPGFQPETPGSADMPPDSPSATPTSAATPAQEATPLPTGTPTPTPLPEPTDEPASADTATLLQDDFSSNTNGWDTEPYSGNLSIRIAEFVDGKLRVTVASKPNAGEGTSAGNWVPSLITKNFVLSVEATIVEAPDQAAIIVGFRDDANGNHYEVVFRTSGFYEVWLRQEDEWQPVIHRASLRDVMVLDGGVGNVIALTVKDSSFTIYANDERLATVADTRLSISGRIWIGARVYERDRSVTVDFDNLIVKEAP